MLAVPISSSKISMNPSSSLLNPCRSTFNQVILDVNLKIKLSFLSLELDYESWPSNELFLELAGTKVVDSQFST